MSYLFLTNIGPVQDFITSARRTRDLHFGSWLLSELARAAASEIVAQNDLTSLIFPAPTDKKMLEKYNVEFSVANKIIALVEQPPHELGPLVHNAIMVRLHDIRDRTFKNVPFEDNNRSIAEAQIEDLIEYLWVSLPFDGHDYEKRRKLLETLMAARKNTRNFAQVTWGDFVPKSSIDGSLESIIPENLYPSRRFTHDENRLKIRRLYTNYKVGPAERLSGVDLLKRQGATAFDTSFPSTSHIATLPFLERLKILKNGQLQQAHKAWNVYIETLKSLVPSAQLELEYIPGSTLSHPVLDRYEGSMLFEERLVDVLYEPGVAASKNGELQIAKKALNQFYQVLDQQFSTLGFTKTRPTSYYALLQADGDGMGEIIDSQAKHGHEQHRKLSHSLSTFTRNASTIVKKHRGSLVYAGGDDVLAFLPLDTVLECATELSKEFRETLLPFADKEKSPPSLSVGIAIAHHLDSLRRVRSLAQDAERSAKGVSGKDALAIIVSKRSGEDYSVAGKWDTLDKSLQQLIGFYRKNAIPIGTAYDLRDITRRLVTSTQDTPISSQEKLSYGQIGTVIHLDALRIIRRKLNVPFGKFPPAQVKEVENFFENFFKEQIDREQTFHPEAKTMPLSFLDDLINMLIVAQVLADVKQLASPERK